MYMTVYRSGSSSSRVHPKYPGCKSDRLLARAVHKHAHRSLSADRQTSPHCQAANAIWWRARAVCKRKAQNGASPDAYACTSLPLPRTTFKDRAKGNQVTNKTNVRLDTPQGLGFRTAYLKPCVCVRSAKRLRESLLGRSIRDQPSKELSQQH